MFIDYRGEPAVAAGWLQRARHHLKSDPDHPAMVAVGAMEAYLALAYDKDPLRARTLVETALEQARRLKDRNAELMANAQLGMNLVSQGEVSEGMRLLDESTAARACGVHHDGRRTRQHRLLHPIRLGDG